MSDDGSSRKRALPRVAVVGSGYWGKNLLRNFHELGALATICDKDKDKLEAFSNLYPASRTTSDFEEVLHDETIHAVAIATPASSHAKLVRQALLAGKDVFVEKPLCLTVADGEALVNLARNRRQILMVGHLLWYHPAILKLKDLIDAGELGQIEYIYSNRLNLGLIRSEENILWSFAPHDLSVILGILNEMPHAVQAQGGYYLQQQIADVTVSLLSFPSGVKAHIFVSWLHPFKEQKLVVVGNRQMAVFNDLETSNKLLLYPHSVNWKSQIPVASKAEPRSVPLEMVEPLQAECLHFLTCVQTRTRPRTDGAEGLRVLTVLQQCQDAMEHQHAPKEHLSNSLHRTGMTKPERVYFAHESAFIDDGVEIGQGTSIWHVSHVLKGSRIGADCKIGQNVVIGPNVTIGEGVKIQNNVCVYEGVTLEDHVFCGPSMVFTNVINPRSEIHRMGELRPTLIRTGASLGANCTILCGVTVGRYAFVGAGAVVTRDVPDYALVVGAPAKITGWMCECGNKINCSGEMPHCQACGKHYAKKEDGVVRVQDVSVAESLS